LPDGRVVVAFQTTSADLRVTGAAYQPQLRGGYDAYVAILDPARAGAAQLLYASYLGGGGNDAPKSVRPLGADRLSVLGWTWSEDFPRTEGSPGLRGSNDVWVTVLDITGPQLVYSTTFGGASWDTPTEALLTPEGDLLVAGRTGSSDFPMVNAMAGFGAAEVDDAMVFLFRPGSGPGEQGRLLFSSSFGGGTAGNDYARGLEIEPAGTFLAAGYTGAPDFPTAAGAVQVEHGGGSRDMFISRFDVRFPTASFTATPAIGPAPLDVQFDASNSAPGGVTSVADYRWDFGDSVTGTGKTATHTYDEDDLGRRIVTLEVENDLPLCAAAQAEVTVHLATENVPPWRGRDVGAPRFPGGSRPFTTGATDDFLLAAGGKDLVAAEQELHFLHQELEGDFALSAHVEDLGQAATLGGHLGLMLREGIEGGSEERFFAVAFGKPGALTQLRTLWRGAEGGPVRHANVDALRGWLRIERRLTPDGSELTSWSSQDGVTWMPLLAFPVLIPDLPPRLQAGVCAARFDRTAPGLTAFTPLRARATHLEALPFGVGARFLRADATADGELNISDPVALLGFLFLGTAAPACEDAADADDTGSLELTDAIYALVFLFLGGPAPPAPFPGCGPDPMDDELGCESPGECKQ
jgi:hypothetical protein